MSYQVVISGDRNEIFDRCLLAGFEVIGSWPSTSYTGMGPPPMVAIALRRETPEGQEPGIVDRRTASEIPVEWAV